MRTVLLVSLVLTCGGLVAGGCGGGGGGGGGAVAPTLGSVTPAAGLMAGGAALQLNGSGFNAGGVSVLVGGAAATGVTVVNDATITCTTPPHATRGLVDVTVTTAGGSATLTNGYTYHDLFAGDFHTVGFAGDHTAPAGLCGWGLWTANGLGQVTGGTTSSNLNGATATAPVGTFPYTLGTDRLLTLQPGGVDTHGGGIAANGNALCVASVRNGVDPWIQLLCRRSGTFTTASVSGTYIWCAFAYNHVASDQVALWGTATFDGAGSVSGGVNSNNDGTVTLSGSFGPDTYSVSADGAFEWDIFTFPQRGGVLQGGDLILCGGGATAPSFPVMTIFIRTTSGATNALFSGQYYLVTLGGSVGPGVNWASITARVTSDGAGTVTWGPGVVNVDGAVAAGPGGGTFSYGVLANGLLGVTGGINNCAGAVSPTGDYAMWAGSGTGGEPPQLYFLVR